MSLTMKNKAKSKVILIVDDIQDNIDIILHCLAIEKENYKVLQATNGLDAIKLVEEYQPDIMLLDYMMPGMTGIDVLRELKQKRNLGFFLPVILVTSKTDVQSKKEALLVGAEDFITKPFQREELIARIKAALRTKSLYDELQSAYKKLDNERDIIAGIQKSLIPPENPRLNKVKFCSRYVPSSKAGGDYYDFAYIDENHLGIVVADVSGHGIPSAVIMAMVKIVFQTCVKNIFSPSKALELFNNVLSENIHSGEFITMFYGILDLNNMSFTYASAGHTPAFYFDPLKNDVWDLETSFGYPLCINLENTFDEKTIAPASGSRLLLFTDGIFDAINKENEFFGLKRLKESFKNLCGKNAEEIVINLEKVVGDFTGGVEFRDDYTLLCLEIV